MVDHTEREVEQVHIQEERTEIELCEPWFEVVMVDISGFG